MCHTTACNTTVSVADENEDEMMDAGDCDHADTGKVDHETDWPPPRRTSRRNSKKPIRDDNWGPSARSKVVKRTIRKRKTPPNVTPPKGCNADRNWALGDALVGQRVAVVLAGRSDLVKGTVVGRVIGGVAEGNGLHAFRQLEQTDLELVDFSVVKDWYLAQ